MTKTELAKTVSKNTGTTVAMVSKILDAAFESMVDGLVEENKVQIAGFGTFEVRERAEREGRNPKTGEKIQIGASKSVGFKAGKTVKDKLN